MTSAGMTTEHHYRPERFSTGAEAPCYYCQQSPRALVHAILAPQYQGVYDALKARDTNAGAWRNRAHIEGADDYYRGPR